MPTILKPTQFGNPVLRQTARRLTPLEIKSVQIQELIENMRHTLGERKYGVGLAAPQVGEAVALSVIGIKPTPNRPELEPFETVIINPEIVERYGRRTQMWEECISCGRGNDTLYARVPRYRKIKLEWHDENGARHERIIDGFPAHVVQHETDHLNGILFVDRVRDTTSYMMAGEYRQRIVLPARKKAKAKQK